MELRKALFKSVKEKPQSRKDKRQVFNEIVEMNKKRIFYLAYDLTGSAEDAEDISQEVFIKAYKSYEKFRGESSTATWLYRITVNTALDFKRKRSFQENKRSLSLDSESGSFSESHIEDKNTFTDPCKSEQNRQIVRDIYRSLDSLSIREKGVFVLRVMQEHSGRETGKIMGISEGTVKSLLFRAVKKLRKNLPDYKDFFTKEVC